MVASMQQNADVGVTATKIIYYSILTKILIANHSEQYAILESNMCGDISYDCA